MGTENITTKELPNAIAWLADAPLFIDDDLVGRFYDAIIKPEYDQGEVKLELSTENARKISGRLGIEGEATLSGVKKWFAAILPAINVSLKASGEAQGETTKTKGQSLEVAFRRIDTPQRRLVQLAVHYLINHESRLFILRNDVKDAWPSDAQILDVPRAIAFIDLAPGTRIIPTAAEFAEAGVVPLYLQLRDDKGGEPPRYPESGAPQELLGKRKEYWKWFAANVASSKAMRVVEEASAGKGRIRWIDYRVMLTNEGDTAHLHVCPAGKYDTGVLAYNLIKRADKHGLRIVGTLKTEPDINVMALYEK